MQEGEQGSQQVGWQYTNTGQAATAGSKPEVNKRQSQPVTWTASEYIDHSKSAGWFVRYILVVVVFIGTIFFLTRDFFSLFLLSVLAIIFAIFAARKPSVLQYRLDGQGIAIGSKFYPINLFRSFAIIEEGAFRSITLLPLKRFMPSISLYYAPDDEAAILEAFSGLLPQETRKQDAIDRFMRRIRF